MLLFLAALLEVSIVELPSVCKVPAIGSLLKGLHNLLYRSERSRKGIMALKKSNIADCVAEKTILFNCLLQLAQCVEKF